MAAKTPEERAQDTARRSDLSRLETAWINYHNACKALWRTTPGTVSYRSVEGRVARYEDALNEVRRELGAIC
jgi:hypothetical protein